MTDAAAVGYVIEMAVVGAGILLAFAVYRRSAMLLYRQRLFEIRNKLWDEMFAAGTLDLPAHRNLRDTINGAIRWAEYSNLETVMLLEIFTRFNSAKQQSTAASTKAAPAVEASLHEARKELIDAFTVQFAFASPIGLVFSAFCLGFLTLAFIWRKLAHWGKQAKSIPESMARFAEPILDGISKIDRTTFAHSRGVLART